ncbi:MAG TPA: flavodoxin domain-containing protein [Actinospica sp.]|jgi:menaquinone-dependent protoporphyrinogen oxidase|nr:flavodoxin domain-containing protein [Actinospica sp.]
MRILISAASRHQGTAEIARHLADALRREGAEVAVIPPDEIVGVSGYAGVVLGSAVYFGRWLPAARRAAERFEKELRERPVWLFSSGPVGAAAADPNQARVNVDDVMARTGAIGHRVFGGRIERAQLAWPARELVSRLRIKDRDDRDWTEIEAWAQSIFEQLEKVRADAP